jgi:hypothetical protein
MAVGGRPPAGVEPAPQPAPAFADPAAGETPTESAAQIEAALEPLAAAVRALGGAARLRQVRGFSAELFRSTGDGAPLQETVWFGAPDRLRRVRHLLATTIETVVAPNRSHEQVDEKKVPLERAEARQMLERAERHPLMLIAAYTRGQIVFRLVGTRRVGDREMAVLQRVDAKGERLRMIIDVGSGLVRAVETRERRADLGARVHVIERYDDYRPVEGGLRAPFRCLTAVDDGPREGVAVWERFEARAPSAQALAAGGPSSLAK